MDNAPRMTLVEAKSPRVAAAGPRRLSWLPWVLAPSPLLAGLYQLVLASGGADTQFMRLDMLFPFEAAVLVTALVMGLTRASLKGALTRLELAALIVFAAVAVLTTLTVAPSRSTAAMAVLQRAGIAMMAVGLVFLIAEAGESLRRGMLMAVAGTILLHLPLVAYLYLTLDARPELNWRGGPMGFWHVRVWGMALAAALGTTAGLWLMATGALGRWLAWSVMALLWMLLFWSGTRGGVVAVLAAWGFAMAILPRRVVPTLLPMLTAMVLGGAASVLLVTPDSAYGILNSLTEAGAAVNAEGADAMTAGRMTLWADALRLIAERPVFGWGFDQYRFISTGRFEGWEQVHNAPLEMVLGFGIVGGGALMLLLGSLWLRGLARVRRSADAVAIGALTGLNALLVFSLVDGPLYHLDPLVYAGVLAALVMARPGGPAGRASADGQARGEPV